MNDMVTRLNALITQINTLLRENTDPDCDQQLWDLRHLFSALRDAALGKIYDQNAPVYGAAVVAMNEANAAADAAGADIAEVQAAIDKLTAAAKAADKVVKLFAKLA